MFKTLCQARFLWLVGAISSLFLFSDFPCFFGAFVLSFPRILGVPRREKPLLFFGASLAFFSKKQGKQGQGSSAKKGPEAALTQHNSKVVCVCLFLTSGMVGQAALATELLQRSCRCRTRCSAQDRLDRSLCSCTNSPSKRRGTGGRKEAFQACHSLGSPAIGGVFMGDYRGGATHAWSDF